MFKQVKEIFKKPQELTNNFVHIGGTTVVDLNDQQLTPYGKIKLTAMNELLEVCNDDDLDAVLRLTLAVLKSRGFTCIPGDVDAIMFDLWKQSEA